MRDIRGTSADGNRSCSPLGSGRKIETWGLRRGTWRADPSRPFVGVRVRRSCPPHGLLPEDPLVRAGDATTACLGRGAMPRPSVRETHPVILGGWPQSNAETTSVGVREPPDPYSISIAARCPVRRSGPPKRPVPRTRAHRLARPCLSYSPVASRERSYRCRRRSNGPFPAILPSTTPPAALDRGTVLLNNPHRGRRLRPPTAV